MAVEMLIDSEDVSAIASELEGLNDDMDDVLQDSLKMMEALRSVWQGNDAEETITAYETHASKYFEEFKSAVEEYVTFLKRQVSEGIINVSNVNKSSIDTFK